MSGRTCPDCGSYYAAPVPLKGPTPTSPRQPKEVDKQDLILRALATLLRMAAADRLERIAAPYGDEHVARATKLITEIDGVVR